jgi:hypothetical protein
MNIRTLDSPLSPNVVVEVESGSDSEGMNEFRVGEVQCTLEAG